MKNVAEELTDPSDLLSLFMATPHSPVKLHFLVGSFQRKELAFLSPPLSFAKAFLISLARLAEQGHDLSLSCCSEEELKAEKVTGR